MIIWDSGTYEAEKFRDSGAEKGGEVIVDLHGQRISGRYALIQTKGDQWLAHRMKEQPAPRLQDYSPMLATLGSVEKLTATQYAFEGKFDGYRLLVEVSDGQLRAQSRSGRDLTADYPQLRALAADLADHDVILDGEVVALDADGVPNFGEMQNRVRASQIEFWAFDILRLDGRSLLKAKYRDRRKILETFAEERISSCRHCSTVTVRKRWSSPARRSGRSRRQEVDSTYQPGRRSAAWIKDKNWNTQEAVIGGWREGNGGRSSGIGALLLGIPDDGGLRFIGRVGTGFSTRSCRGSRRSWSRCTPTNHPSPHHFPDSMPRGHVCGPSWSVRCASASGPPTADCATRVGAAYGPTRRRATSSSSRRFNPSLSAGVPIRRRT